MNRAELRIVQAKLPEFWREYGDRMCWDYRPASWWQRWFLIRHVRAWLVHHDQRLQPAEYRDWLSAGIACGFDR
jgi:hypothetical protein